MPVHTSHAIQRASRQAARLLAVLLCLGVGPALNGCVYRVDVQQGNLLVLSHTDAASDRYIWIFDAASGRLRETSVKLGTFDTLLVEYTRYNAHGWPEEVTLTRKARFYTINLTFNDGSIVRRP